MSFNFIPAVTICSDFGAPQNSLSLFPLFPHLFAMKWWDWSHLVKAMFFTVVMNGCENWTIKKAEHWKIDAFDVVLEKILESPLDCKEIQPVHPKGDQSWVLIGRTDVETETLILWPPDVKNWIIWKDPDAVKHWGQEEKGMTEDEMVGWHYRLHGDEFG